MVGPDALFAMLSTRGGRAGTARAGGGGEGVGGGMGQGGQADRLAQIDAPYVARISNIPRPDLAVQSPIRLVVTRCSTPDATTSGGSVWTNVNLLPSGSMNRSHREPSG
jgi:hypothetical protein